jgi:hypothetical protein
MSKKKCDEKSLNSNVKPELPTPSTAARDDIFFWQIDVIASYSMAKTRERLGGHADS